MGTRNPSSAAPGRGARTRESGTISVQMLVILTPVLIAMIGFAVDLGRLYLVRSELKAAANSAALAAAQRLIGTEAAVATATASAAFTTETGTGFGNKYDFNGRAIGETAGLLSSKAPALAFFGALADATGSPEGGGAGEVGGADARYVKVEVEADAPLVFWGMLTLAQERKVPVFARAVAGVSAPLCTACSIEPLAVAAPDASDTTDFGFIRNTKYTFFFSCSGTPLPSVLTNAGVRLPYLILNRYNESATTFADEQTQLYRAGAQGLPGSTTQAQACFTLNAEEQIWVSATPPACSANRVPTPVQSLLCGFATRFDPAVASGCENIADVDTLAAAYQPDTDVADQEDYLAYTGNGRRVITAVVVDTLNAAGAMVVLGFRQFLLDPPSPETATLTPGDPNGRFIGLYVGNPMPLRQGRFDGCQQTAGPGKVVLHE